MNFETERLILRPWKDEDVTDLYLAAKEPSVGLPCGWAPHPDLEHSRKILKTILQNETTWALELKETGHVVGTLSLMFPGVSELATENEAELGAWIAVASQGQGLIPEGARALLNYAFRDLELNAVWAGYWAGYYEGNTKSCRMQEKLGFKPVRTVEHYLVPALSEYRTLHINHLSKEDWLAHE